MLRELRPDLRIGFFLHIPFPPTELFMQLPWRRRIIEGLLGADLVGFHTPGGARNFRWLATRLTDATAGHGRNEVDLRRPHRRARRVPDLHRLGGAGPAGRAPPRSLERAKQIRADLGDPTQVVLGVDRLDYTKGIDVRLRAFEELLVEGRVDAEDTVMIQLATPSRERVEHYQQMRDDIEQSVGRINGEYARVGHPAVHYLHQSLPREELAAFYVAADVMLVTPLRDGMNLVAKEYVACRHDNGGVLVLSEFAGAAHELKDAMLVNPHDTDGVKNALHAALTMTRAGGPAADAGAAPPGARARRRPLGPLVPRRARAAAGRRKARRERSRRGRAGDRPARRGLLVALDFDGVLAPIVDVPSDGAAAARSAAAVGALATLPDTTVALVSGRGLADLAAVSGFGSPVRLIGSHGGEFDDGGAVLDDEQRARKARRLAAGAAELIDGEPGVALEDKPAGVAVHVRNADPDVGERALDAVRSGPATWSGIEATQGKAVLDLAVVQVSKGARDRRAARAARPDAVLFVGDDVTDETAFVRIRPGDVGVKVGQGETAAEYRFPALPRSPRSCRGCWPFVRPCRDSQPDQAAAVRRSSASSHVSGSAPAGAVQKVNVESAIAARGASSRNGAAPSPLRRRSRRDPSRR